VYEDRRSDEPKDGEPPAPIGRAHLGDDLGRIISLSDGVFAFALTLLVLTLVVPTVDTSGPASAVSSRLGAKLGSDWQEFLGYAFAFVMIGLWWMIHHRTFRYIRRYDQILMWLNMLVLLEIAVMPFILSVFTTYSYTQVGVALFAFMQLVTGLTLNLIWRYAARNHRFIDATLPEAEIRYFANRGILPAVAFGLSIAVTFVNVNLAELLWFVPVVLNRFSDRYGVV
jgi:TMEM175 potassium channel family protein